MYSDGLTFAQIAAVLSKEENIQVNVRTLKRRFQAWGLKKQLPRTVEDVIKTRIQVLYSEDCLEDREILVALRDEGYDIGKYTLVRLRFELGLRRRVRGVEESREADQGVR